MDDLVLLLHKAANMAVWKSGRHNQPLTGAVNPVVKECIKAMK